MKKVQLKARCHRCMREIWGDGKHGKARAYIWLKKKYNREIHFAEIDDMNMLQEIHNELWRLSFRKSFCLKQNE